MNHPFIEEHNIPFLYLLGKLPPEEQERFEDHFTACRECLDRLETTEHFIGGLKSMATVEWLQPGHEMQNG
jgi:hypothetical protein